MRCCGVCGQLNDGESVSGVSYLRKHVYGRQIGDESWSDVYGERMNDDENWIGVSYLRKHVCGRRIGGESWNVFYGKHVLHLHGRHDDECV